MAAVPGQDASVGKIAKCLHRVPISEFGGDGHGLLACCQAFTNLARAS